MGFSLARFMRKIAESRLIAVVLSYGEFAARPKPDAQVQSGTQREGRPHAAADRP
jgi:hypothetical protein